VKRLKLAAHGRNMRTIKDQLARLSASSVRLGMIREGQAITVNSQIVTAFDLWFPKDDRQRVLWPSTVRLSLDYFESLKAHAVPLDERALAARPTRDLLNRLAATTDEESRFFLAWQPLG
jgi:hypothetical protein